MQGLKNTMMMMLLFAVMISCSKGNSDNLLTQTAPSNLVVVSTPSTDGSGNVSFEATATHAVNYIFEYGDGIIESVAGGKVTHQYVTAGNITYTVIVTAKSISGLSINKSIVVTVNVSGGGFSKLVFDDEFNTNGTPNAAKWGFDIGTGNGGWGNNELQYYTMRPENVIVQGGVLKINAIRENYQGSTFTSARLLSKDKYSFQYGKIEVRARFPAGTGTWPAAWMLGDDIHTVGWPACGEIDIAEHVGRDLNKIYGTVHYPGRSGGNGDGRTIINPDATTEFHTYSVEWSASVIKFYVDTQVYHTVNNNGTLPFNHNFFILLNLAMGGNLGGPVDPSLTGATYEIDYVRVYQ